MKSQEELEELVEGLSVRLQRVEDIAEIQRLKAEYGRLTDARYDRNGVVERSALERLEAHHGLVRVYDPETLRERA